MKKPRGSQKAWALSQQSVEDRLPARGCPSRKSSTDRECCLKEAINAFRARIYPPGYFKLKVRGGLPQELTTTIIKKVDLPPSFYLLLF